MMRNSDPYNLTRVLEDLLVIRFCHVHTYVNLVPCRLDYGVSCILLRIGTCILYTHALSCATLSLLFVLQLRHAQRFTHLHNK